MIKVIFIEGIYGAGKSTLLKELSDHFNVDLDNQIDGSYYSDKTNSVAVVGKYKFVAHKKLNGSICFTDLDINRSRVWKTIYDLCLSNKYKFVFTEGWRVLPVKAQMSDKIERLIICHGYPIMLDLFPYSFPNVYKRWFGKGRKSQSYNDWKTTQINVLKRMEYFESIIKENKGRIISIDCELSLEDVLKFALKRLGEDDE